MKNLHVLPTDKRSRLSILNSGKLNFGAEAMSSSNSKLQHIYITSDEQAKEGDWGYIPFEGGNVKLVGKYFADDWKKIILTTDQDLIADGIQAIDDIFLEWFVENPSCEEIKVELHEVSFVVPDNIYKIIIPQKEPKQETLEEVAKEYASRYGEIDIVINKAVRFGAEWQAEGMYSEEEVFNLCRDFVIFIQQKRPSYKKQLEWFEQFKKKGGEK
jgi:hypothetical protein